MLSLDCWKATTGKAEGVGVRNMEGRALAPSEAEDQRSGTRRGRKARELRDGRVPDIFESYM